MAAIASTRSAVMADARPYLPFWTRAANFMSEIMFTLLLQFASSVPRPTVIPAACISATGAMPEPRNRLLTALLATLTSKAFSVLMSLLHA
jgi:hypothetical protein